MKFIGTEFNLALSGVPENGMYLHIYLPKGEEDIINYNEKLSLLVMRTDKTAIEVVKKKIRELEQRQKKDLNCTFNAKVLPDNKGILLESVTADKDGSKIVKAEYTISRVKTVSITGIEASILIYSYSWRTYDEETSDLLKNIREFKTRYITEISNIELPEIHLHSKQNLDK